MIVPTRRGISLYLVIGALLVISVFSFATNRLAVETLRRTRRIVDGMDASLLLRSAVAVVVSGLNEGLADPRSPLRTLLLSPDLATGTFVPIDLTPVRDIARQLREGAVDATVRIMEISPLDPERLGLTTGGCDPAERRCLLEIEALAQVGGTERQRLERRELRLVHLMPGILGKFSFFLADPGSDPLAYNRYANHLEGEPDDRVPPAERVLPLVFKNGDELDEGADETEPSDSYQRRGYIFAGGSGLTLNLTAGRVETYGENFHFFRIGTRADIPGFYDPEPTPFLCQGPDFSTPRHAQTLNPVPPFRPDLGFAAKNVVYGFYTTDDLGSDMNAGEGRFSVTLPGPATTANPRMRSSILHLFGTSSNPSPTLVLGEVRRRYAIFAGLIVEGTGDATRDGLVTTLPERPRLEEMPVFPSTIKASAWGTDLPAGTEIRFAPDQLTWEGIFGGDTGYRARMCRVIEEPYLRSHDFLYFKPDGGFFPPKSQFGGTQASLQETFSLAFHPSIHGGRKFFDRGELENLGGHQFAAKGVYRVPDAVAFCQRFVDPRNGELNLDCAVVITGKKDEVTALPPQMVIRKGGMILLEAGTLRLGRLVAGPDPDEVVTVIAEQGDIQVDLTGGEALCARLIALEGRVINLTPAYPLDLRGGLAMREFPPTSFPAGGKLVWQSTGDPSGIGWGYYYRAFVSDIPLLPENL